MIHGILILGAHYRNSTAILVWMIFELVILMYASYVGVILVILLTRQHGDEQLSFGWVIYGIFMSATNILFILWTILVAKGARNEIKEEE